MAGPRFSRVEVIARRERISQLYLQGKTLRQIGQEVGVSHQQVHLDIKAIRSDWRTHTHMNFEEKKKIELARVDQVENEAWNGWTRTVGIHKTTREELEAGGSKEGGPKKKLVRTSEKFAGDPRFLSVVLECVRRRSEILGLNNPIEARIQGKLTIQDVRDILDAADKDEDEETVQ